MDRVEAVQAAKEYAKELFADEHISEILLEELNFDPDKDEWLITVSFAHTRPTPQATTPLARGRLFGDRQYKVVHIADRTSEFAGVTDRLLTPLA